MFDSISLLVTRWLCQSDADAQRFIRLGVSAEKINAPGFIKFDIKIEDYVVQQGKALREQLGSQRPITWVAASTHKGT